MDLNEPSLELKKKVAFCRASVRDRITMIHKEYRTAGAHGGVRGGGRTKRTRRGPGAQEEVHINAWGGGRTTRAR